MSFLFCGFCRLQEEFLPGTCVLGERTFQPGGFEWCRRKGMWQENTSCFRQVLPEHPTPELARFVITSPFQGTYIPIGPQSILNEWFALHASTERLFWYIEGLQIQVAARPRKGKIPPELTLTHRELTSLLPV